MLVTGGDDNAIHVILLDLTWTEGQKVKVKVIGSNSKLDAHAAQVTGKFIGMHYLSS
jgi:hypothetical protein